LHQIHNPNTKIIKVDDSSIENINGVPSISMFDQLNMSFKDQVVFVGFSAEQDIAVMNEETSKILRDLSSFDSCRTQVFIGESSRISLHGARKDAGKERFMQVDIVIYGSPEIRKSVGRLLSAARIYLQHPCHQDPNTEYDNPHFLDLTDLSTTSTLTRGISGSHTPLGASETLMTSSGEPGESSTMGDALQTKLARVFNSLTRYKTLKRLEADIKITTPLLP
jgi:SWI/SNF-related matrix-associated actin-dependent regulator of chromatin subfamily A3